MSNCDSDDEKVIDFQIHRIFQSFGTLTNYVNMQILQVNSD